MRLSLGLLGKRYRLLSHCPVAAGSCTDPEIIVNINWSGLGRCRKIWLVQT